MIKKLILFFAYIISFIWLIFPKFLRIFVIKSLLLLESRKKNINISLKNIFEIKFFIDKIINERAMKYENSGIHPKHRLINYHNFFIDNIQDSETVLDLGCGYGAVATTVAKNKTKSTIVGVDNDKPRLDQAIEKNNLSNLSFVNANIENNFKIGKFDVVIMSNVLEHMKDRKNILKNIKEKIQPKKLLIRVPLYERDWMVPFMDELKINYFLDDDHEIEHKIFEFTEEMNKAGFNIKQIHTIWGEIWAVCENT